MEYILVFVAGFTALGLTAACWFYIMSPYGSHWYPAEVGIYFALATLYVLQKWTSTSSAIILIAGFHYGFWFLRFWEYGEERFQLLVPIIGLFAGIAWVIYVPIGRARLFPTSPSG